MFVERPILAAVRRECARQRIRSKPSSQRFTFQSVGDIIHHPETRLAFATEFKARPRVVALLLRHPTVSMPIRSAIYVIAAILWLL